MKNVSKEFRDKTYEGTLFYQTAKIVFADGREKTLGKRDFYMSGNGFSDGPGVNSFPLGEAISKHITLLLVNDDDRFSDYDFYMASITVWLNCDLSETTESILIGEYTVTTPEVYGAQVTVEAIDDMYKGNMEYTTELVYPASLETILRDSCLSCGVNLLTTSFSNSSFVVKEKPENITHRQLWGMIAMIAGGNARMDANNRLEIKEYDFSYFEKVNLDGGYFDTITPYESGDDADGGDFTDWSTGDAFDGGTFGELNDFHMFFRTKIPTIATDDVVITGIQTTVDEKTYLFGSEGYILKVDNQLIADNPNAAVEFIGDKLVGLRFRPFTIDHKAYPLAEFGDLCYVADRKGNVYQSVVTDVSFNYFGYTTISCSADDPVRNSSKYYSSSTEAIVEARKNTKKQLGQYDLAVQQLTNLITNSFGVFKTEERLKDGSVIYYLHDKPELSSSTKIWKMTADAFAVSSDGGKTWDAGLDSEGNAVVNILSAIGINADWVITGILMDAAGKNFWDMANGDFSMSATAKVGDSIVASQQNVADSKDSAYLYADNAVNELDNSLTMQNVFNRLTNNGTVQGLYMQNGQLYINASYVLAGILTGIAINNGSGTFSVDANGNIVANSFSSNNAKITGGNINISADAGVSVISLKAVSTYLAHMRPSSFRILESTSGGVNGTSISSDGVVAGSWSALSENAGLSNTKFALYSSDGSALFSGDLAVLGSKSRLAKTENYGDKLLYCYETTTPMFGDIGEGKIDETGKCYVFIDDIFGETIDTGCSYQVFLQPYGKGECYVVERNTSYFIVVGTENLLFGWEVKAIQKNYDTMRLEEYEAPTIEENTIAETEAYLNSLVNDEDIVTETESYLESLVYQKESEK